MKGIGFNQNNKVTYYDHDYYKLSRKWKFIQIVISRVDTAVLIKAVQECHPWLNLVAFAMGLVSPKTFLTEFKFDGN